MEKLFVLDWTACKYYSYLIGPGAKIICNRLDGVQKLFVFDWTGCKNYSYSIGPGAKIFRI